MAHKVTGVLQLILLPVIAGALTGCAASTTFSQYQETIQQFQEATDKTAKVTTAYLVDLNNYERKLELDRLRQDPNRVLDIPKNFLAPKFQPEAIQARMQAFDVLRRFTSLLADLADSDAPKRWSASAQGLKGSAEGLLTTLESVDAGTGNAGDLVAPLTTLVDMIGQDYINSKREAALSKAIATAAPAIREISDLLKRDMETVIVQRARTLNEPLIDIAGEYETAQKEQKAQPNAARDRKRLAILDELQSVLEEREQALVTLQGLSTAMAAFDEALGVLESYARTSKDKRDLTDVVATVARYGAAADALLSAFETTSS